MSETNIQQHINGTMDPRSITIDEAMQRVQQVEAHLDSAKDRKKECDQALMRVMRKSGIMIYRAGKTTAVVTTPDDKVAVKGPQIIPGEDA